MHKKKKLYRCFCCFHVRSGALALGAWHLMVHLFAISLLAYMSSNIDEINSTVHSLTIIIRRGKGDVAPIINDSDTEKTNSNSTLLTDSQDDQPLALPVSMQNNAPSRTSSFSDEDTDGGIIGQKGGMGWTSYVYTYSGLSSQPQLNHHDLNAAFIIGCLIVAISTLMIVGIVKGKPAYIFPFLGYQLGDLFVSSLTVAGVICLGPNIKQFLLAGDDFPYREEVEQMDNQYLIMSVALAILGVVFIKAYFVQVVWLTIRYLREQKIRKLQEECQPKVIFLDGASGSGSGNETLYIFDNDGGVVKKSPPPSYEAEEVKVAPPAYTV
ncbi:hypothetical protein BV898_12542 [Hypsibius exemplaris]|uniref:Lysosomal-associated transmembrane protein 4A n=1 Tax=Hypsibius exemplaris TaxID=2072580 RepID=A0A1W0WDE7_HYPEX|nr:hypothetical protein BV898_12542 [Hypsibius exemplaris]